MDEQEFRSDVIGWLRMLFFVGCFIVGLLIGVVLLLGRIAEHIGA